MLMAGSQGWLSVLALGTAEGAFVSCFCRKHTLNCHRMKPALFQVLCEIKEKTGEHGESATKLVQIVCNLSKRVTEKSR